MYIDGLIFKHGSDVLFSGQPILELPLLVQAPHRLDPRGSLKNGPSTEFAGSPVAVRVVGYGAHKKPGKSA